MLEPSENSGLYLKDGYLLGLSERVDANTLAEDFARQNLAVFAADGSELPADAFVGTGATVGLRIGDTVLQRAVVVVAGDVNGNGRVDVGDYLMIRRHLLGTLELNKPFLLAADSDGNGTVATVDYIQLKRYLLGTLDVPDL